MYKRILVGVVLLTVFLLGVGLVGWAAPLFQARSVLTYPTDGMTVSGQVEVKGVATHPNMNFYQLRYAAGARVTGESQWVDFAIVEGQQIENDVLGTWDTTQIPDGQYALALAVWGFDDPNSPYVSFITNITVNNAQLVATPTSEQQATAEPVATSTPGPTPTPVTIQQPATPTPRPTPTLQAGEEVVATPSAEEGEGSGVALNFRELGDAFCTGGLFAVLMLLLWGLYLLAKVSLRWYLRHRSESSSGETLLG